MKKLLVLSTFALFALASCKKTVSENQRETDKVSLISGSTEMFKVTDDGYLHFASPEAYNAVLSDLNALTEEELNNWEKVNGYTSSYTHYGIANIDEDDSVAVYGLNDNFRNKGFVDPFLLRIIDKDGILRIGDYLFKFMIDDGYILQMYAKDMRMAYQDFRSGTFNARFMNKLVNAHVDQLNANEDIFDLLGTGVVGLQPMSFTIRDIFGDKGVSWHDGPVTGTPNEINPYKVKLVGVYQNAIVYRAFRAKFKYYTRSGILEIPHPTVININYNISTATYKKRDNSIETVVPTTAKVSYTTNTRDNLTWLIYGGAFEQRLRNGNFNVEWSYKEKYTGANLTMSHYYYFD